MIAATRQAVSLALYANLRLRLSPECAEIRAYFFKAYFHPMIDLNQKVCLVTGAGEGIGAGIVRGFARRGARVVATDIQTPQHAEAEMNLAYNVSDAARASQVVEETVRRCGRLDAFVANAGVMTRQRWDEISPDDWRDMMRVNLDGAWHGAQAAARVMKEQGSGKIVFVSSVEILMGVADHCHYDATKAALIGLTRSLAHAVGKDGVRVNCVMPGAVQTEGEARFFPDQESLAQTLAERQCLPHRLTPDGIEPVFAFLCSSESDCISGQVICADHGLVHW